MFGMDSKPIPHSFKSFESAQIHCALLALRLQHILLGIVLVIFVGIYFYNSNIFYPEIFPLWMTAAFVLLAISLVIEYFFILDRNLKTIHKNIFLYCSSFIAGLFCALSYYTINLDLEQMVKTDHLLLLASLILCVSATHLSAVLFLSYQYKHFLIFIIPACLPLLHLGYSLDHLPHASLLYPLALCVYLSFIFITAFLMSRSYRKNVNSLVELELLDQKYQSAHQHVRYMDKRLVEENRKYQLISEKMAQNNAIMEEKIKERLADIKKINERLERSHQNLELAHETAGIASWDWDIQNRCIETGNFTQLFGYNIQSVNYYIQYLDEFIHPDDIDNVKANMRQHLRGFTDRYDMTYRVLHQTEGWIWIHDLGRVIQRDEESKIPLRMVGIRRNIQHEKKAEERLNLSANVFKKMAQGIFVLDDKLRYVDANSYFLSLVKLTEQELIGRYIFDISKSHTNELKNLHVGILQQLLKKGEFDGELVETLQNGTEIPLWIHVNSIVDSQNRITQYIGIVTDLTERKNAEKKLSYLQTYDPLTDLPNRTYFNNKLFNYLSDFTKIKGKLAVIRINLDRFRYYNELLNQQGGDDLLKEVAFRLRRVSAEAAVVARLNADDFSVILEFEQSNQHVTEYCKRVIQIFDDTFKIGQQEFILTISIGIAIFPEHGRQMDSLNRHAEIALLDAKRIGGNTVRIYHHEKSLASEPRLKLESELRKAITNKELVIFLQPKFISDQKKIYGFEALVRWNHPEHGILPPAHFIPLAEETSLISDIGTQVLELACAQLKQWNDLGLSHLTISVNVVVQQIYREHLIEEIDYFVKKYGIQPSQLELEITETSLMENNECVRRVIEDLHQREIKISIDDFGIGYSSLSYLADYAFDVIKIDRSFINGIGSPSKEAIIRAIIAMAKAMNKSIIAEGVETQAHYDFLLKEGCDHMQGFLLGKPMPTDIATDLILSEQHAHSAKL